MAASIGVLAASLGIAACAAAEPPFVTVLDLDANCAPYLGKKIRLGAYFTGCSPECALFADRAGHEAFRAQLGRDRDERQRAEAEGRKPNYDALGPVPSMVGMGLDPEQDQLLDANGRKLGTMRHHYVAVVGRLEDCSDGYYEITASDLLPWNPPENP